MCQFYVFMDRYAAFLCFFNYFLGCCPLASVLRSPVRVVFREYILKQRLFDLFSSLSISVSILQLSSILQILYAPYIPFLHASLCVSLYGSLYVSLYALNTVIDFCVAVVYF